MSDMRDIRDRNDVYFGMPDMDVEREINYLKDDVQRKVPAVDSVVPGTQVQPKVVAPPVPALLFSLNGLPLSPPFLVENEGQPSFSEFSHRTSFTIDKDGSMGSGAGTIWALVSRDVGSTVLTEIRSWLVTYSPATNAYATVGIPEYEFAYLTGAYDVDMRIVNGVLVLDHGVAGRSRFYRWTVAGGFVKSDPCPESFQRLYPLNFDGLSCLMTNKGYIYSPDYDEWFSQEISESVYGATEFMSNGDYVWAYGGSYPARLLSVEASAITPVEILYGDIPWNLRATNPGLPQLSSSPVVVMPDSGNLVYARVPAYTLPYRWGVDSYDFLTGGVVSREGIFSSDGLASSGEPDTSGTIRIRATDGCLVFDAPVSSSFFGRTIPRTSSSPTSPLYVRAISKLAGTGGSLESTATIFAQNNVNSWPSMPPPSPTWNSQIFSECYLDGNKVWTWISASLHTELGAAPDVVNIESWVREHNL